MNKVLVFTNAYRWNELSSCFEGIDEFLWDKPFQDIENSKLFKCGVNENNTAILQTTNDYLIPDEGVYLVYDSIDNDLLGNIISQCKDDNLFILVHTRGISKEQIDSFGVNCIKQQGMHDSTSYYYDVFEILTDKKPDKTSRIIKVVFMDTVKKNFLSGCSIPHNNNDQFRLAYNILRKQPGLENDMEEFMSVYEQCDNWSAYREHLNKLKHRISDELI